MLIKVIGTFVLIIGTLFMMFDTVKKCLTSSEVKRIKSQIEDGSYDWDSAIEDTADRIIDNPESLLWD